MNPRERVQAIIDRKPVDRFPVDIWYTHEVYESLAKHCRTQDHFEIYQKLGIDKVLITPIMHEGPRKKPRVEGGYVNEWGVEYSPIQAGNAQYHEISHYPLQELETIEELEKFPWPDPEKYNIAKMVEYVESFHKDYVVLSPFVSIFETYFLMRGQEQAFCDFIEDPEFVEYACDKIVKTQLAMLRPFLEKTKDGISMLAYSDDVGSQNGMMFSKEMWRHFFKGRAKQFCDLGMEHGLKAFYHTDGASRPIIPELIEIGVGAINPVQHTCPGMELEGLKKDFGDHLIFHGGIDTQKVLPFGSPDDVRKETRQCLEQLGAGGEGYICCSCHNIQAGTPIGNILAMIDTVKSHTPV